MGTFFKIFILSCIVAAIFSAKEELATQCSNISNKEPSGLLEKLDGMTCNAVKDNL